VLSAAVVTAQSSTAQYDVIFRHGTVIDGTGAPRYRADVAIVGGSIARVDLERIILTVGQTRDSSGFR
jgi:N-acyl-D-aspartate/D-glutamate deacylase